jgi:hypothetical protein
LRFSNSSAIPWSSNAKLTIRNWKGTNGNIGDSGRIFFGTDANGLTQEQLRRIFFDSICGKAILTTDGELIPSTEPLSLGFSGNPGYAGAVYVGGVITVTGCQMQDVNLIKVGTVDLSPGDFTVDGNSVSFTYTSAMGTNPIQLFTGDPAVLVEQTGPITNLGYLSATTSGYWSDPSSWLGNGVPGINQNATIESGNLIEINADIAAESRPDKIIVNVGGSLTIADGLTVNIKNSLTNNGQVNTGGNTTIQFTDINAVLENNGTFNDNLLELPGKVSFDSSATISGTNPITFNDLEIKNGTVRLPLNGDQAIPSIKGDLVIKGGIFRTSGTAVGPKYLPGSNLIYQSGGNYTRGIEWHCTQDALASTTPGYPSNIIIDNNTTLNLRNNGLPSPLPTLNPITLPRVLPVNGNLIISRGAIFNNLAGTYAGPLKVFGNVVQGSDPDLGANINFGTSSNSTLIIEGDFERKVILNSGTPYENRFMFTGSGNSLITLAGLKGFRELEVNKTGVGEVILGSTVNINEGGVVLTSGTIKTDGLNNKNLILDSLSTIAGGSSNSFIDGALHKITTQSGDGALDFEFKVGKKLGVNDLIYAPVWIADLENSGNTIFSAEFNSTSTSVNPFAADFFGDNVTGIWNSEWWEVDKVSGTGQARVGIPYEPKAQGSWSPFAPPETDGCPDCRVGVIRYDGDTDLWRFTNNGTFNNLGFYKEALVPSITDMVYSAKLTNFSPFTIGFGIPGVLPLQVLSFDAVLAGEDAKLNWTIADAHELKKMYVEHSKDGRTFSEIAVVNYGQKNEFEYIHKNIGPGVHYYRIRLENKDGKKLFSRVEMVVNNADKTIITGLVQNPLVGGIAIVKVYSAKPQRMEAGVYDLSGRMLLRQNVSLQSGNNRPNLSLGVLPGGIYKIVLRTEDGTMHTLSAYKN